MQAFLSFIHKSINLNVLPGEHVSCTLTPGVVLALFLSPRAYRQTDHMTIT